MELAWRQGQPPPPEGMTSIQGSVAVAHGSTAYFSRFHDVYSYTVTENKWTKLPECKYSDFAMAVINDALTTIGGADDQKEVTNTLPSLSGSAWKEVLPPMPTKRMHPAAANTPTHLVVAGGILSLTGGGIATVEVLNTETLQWSTASSLPEAVRYLQMTTCGGCLYLADDKSNLFSCSMGDILKSTNSSSIDWTRLSSIPVEEDSSLAILGGHVLAVGGHDSDTSTPTGAIHCYDEATNSWSVIGVLPTPRDRVLTAVLASNELVVVGGWGIADRCSITEIGQITH